MLSSSSSSSRPSKSAAASSKRSSVVELKAVTSLPVLAADTTSAVQLLNGLAPGVAIDQRIGRQAKFVRIEGHALFAVTAGTGVDQGHRLLLVLDHQPNGAALATADVLNTVSTISLPSISNAKRFTIVLDKSVRLNSSGEAGSQKVFHVSIPLGFSTQFNAGTAGTIADIATNSFYVVVIGTEAAGATAGTVRLDCRLRYYD